MLIVCGAYATSHSKTKSRVARHSSPESEVRNLVVVTSFLWTISDQTKGEQNNNNLETFSSSVGVVLSLLAFLGGVDAHLYNHRITSDSLRVASISAMQREPDDVSNERINEEFLLGLLKLSVRCNINIVC